MQHSVSKSGEFRNFVDSIYSQNLSNDLLSEQAEQICKIMDSHYFATFLFSNRYSVENYFYSNNPPEFNDVYFQLQDKDALMQSMVKGNTPILYSDLIKLDLPEHKEFFGELNPLRPVSDCCYFPMTINGRLCGFNGIARADAGNRIFDQDDLELFSSISGFLNESLLRSMSSESEDDCEAVLDADGNIIYAGRAIEDYFRFVFGDRYWKSPCTGDSYFSLLFTRHLRGFLDPCAQIGSGSLSLPVKDLPAALEFKRISSPEFRSAFRDQPQVLVSLKKHNEGTGDSGILDWELLKRRYDFSNLEADIIDCIYRGLTDQDISALLRLNEDVLQWRINDIYRKTAVNSRGRLILSLI